MTNDIVTFIRARLDEKAAHAHKDIWAADRATPNWEVQYGINLPHSLIQAGESTIARVENPNHDADAFLMARFKPDNVRKRAEQALREVEATRQILDLHGTDTDPCDAHDAGLRSIPCDTLLALSLPHAGHPDYRTEWRP